MKVHHTVFKLISFAAIMNCSAYGEDVAPPKGILGIETVEAEGEEFVPAFEVARSVGMQFASVSVAWDEIESAPGQFQSDTLGDAGTFYSSESVPLLVILSPIDTNNLRVPEDLRGKSFASKEMKARFRALLDYAFSRIGSVEVVAFAIGNEVDGYLGGDSAKWKEYESFLKDAVQYVHKKRRKTRAGTIFGFDGLRSARAQKLLAVSDVAMTTYYPLAPDFSVRSLTDVPKDFDAMVAASHGRKLIVTECGYPSSAVNGGSEQLQSDFVAAVLSAWNSHSDRILHLSYFSLTDYPEAFVNELGSYYGIDDKKFLGYLSSLGLRRADGSPKPALERLKKGRSKL